MLPEALSCVKFPISFAFSPLSHRFSLSSSYHARTNSFKIEIRITNTSSIPERKLDKTASKAAEKMLNRWRRSEATFPWKFSKGSLKLGFHGKPALAFPDYHVLAAQKPLVMNHSISGLWGLYDRQHACLSDQGKTREDTPWKKITKCVNSWENIYSWASKSIFLFPCFPFYSDGQWEQNIPVQRICILFRHSDRKSPVFKIDIIVIRIRSESLFFRSWELRYWGC